MGSMEGKEVRFGIAQSAMFTTTTTSFTTGTVNNMHDTLTPLGGMIPLLHMMLNVVFGGKGVGLMNMIMYAILRRVHLWPDDRPYARVPGQEDRGPGDEAHRSVHHYPPLPDPGLLRLAVSTAGGLAGITNPGFHGLSQVLYEYASSAANDGLGFEGLADNSYFWNITAGWPCSSAATCPSLIQLAIAGSLMRKRFAQRDRGHPAHRQRHPSPSALVCVVYIFAALTFFPALALGPIAEHLTLWA